MNKKIAQFAGALCLSLLLSCNGETSTTEETTTDTAMQAVPATSDSGANALMATTCDGCANVEPCSDACLAAILGCHEISPSEFTNRTTGVGFSGIGHSPKTVQQICDEVAQADCAASTVIVNGRHQTASVDNDITFTIEPMSPDDKATPVAYRIPMFRAICDKHPRDIKFFKGKRSNGEDDILIRVEYEDGTTVHYDISDIPPAHLQQDRSN